MGASLGLVGHLVGEPGRIAVGTLMLATLACAALVSPRRLLQFNRETEQSLVSRGPYEWAVVNGALLGMGFTSRIGYWLPYLVPIGRFVAGSWLFGALIWGTYGIVRLAVAAVLAYQVHTDPSRTAELGLRLLNLTPAIRRVVSPMTAVCSLGLAVWLGI